MAMMVYSKQKLSPMKIQWIFSDSTIWSSPIRTASLPMCSLEVFIGVLNAASTCLFYPSPTHKNLHLKKSRDFFLHHFPYNTYNELSCMMDICSV